MPDRDKEIADKVREFVKAQRILCAETIYQTDWVIENAYEFIEQLCDLAGYAELADADADA